jgi:hypothetical protein
LIAFISLRNPRSKIRTTIKDLQGFCLDGLNFDLKGSNNA